MDSATAGVEKEFGSCKRKNTRIGTEGRTMDIGEVNGIHAEDLAEVVW